MAKLEPGVLFTGPLSGLSAYKRRDSDKIILRAKGGASREKIKHAPSFANTRRVNAEFGGCAKASRWFRRTFQPLHPLSDYNMAGPVAALMMPIQKLDTQSAWGHRAIRLTLQPGLLEGLNLNKRFPFDAVVRNPVSGTIDREALQARVAFPALLPGVTFFAPGRLPLFRIVAALGAAPDLWYHAGGYRPEGDYGPVYPHFAHTDWFAVKSGAPATELELALPVAPPNEAYSLVLTAGVEMGTLGTTGLAEGTRYAGSAKVLAIG